jgi:predicted DNA-binding protein (MmcQ/YjbR family)
VTAAPTLEEAFAALRRHGLAFPEAAEDHPWGHCALKVRAKTFAWLNLDPGRLGVTVKLPVSRDFALCLDFTEPTGYGLGRAGWVTSVFSDGDAVDLDLLKRWLAESYRAVAPKKLAALLPADN